MFQQLYQYTLKCSGHKYAHWYLGLIAFIESSFFPIPPDVMLVSMGLAKPQKALHHAFIATLFSVLGGMFGYAIGYYVFDLIYPWLSHSSLFPAYQIAIRWFQQFGVVAVILAAFTPIPYKLFTIGAGATHMLFLPFIVGSIIGRGLRFFIVSSLLFFFGERIEKQLLGIIDKLAWIVLALAGIIYVIYRIYA